jgi:hypothetical protein
MTVAWLKSAAKTEDDAKRAERTTAKLGSFRIRMGVSFIIKPVLKTATIIGDVCDNRYAMGGRLPARA